MREFSRYCLKLYIKLCYNVYCIPNCRHSVWKIATIICHAVTATNIRHEHEQRLMHLNEASVSRFGSCCLCIYVDELASIVFEFMECTTLVQVEMMYLPLELHKH